MKVGIPREVKPDEYRVSVTPAGVHALTAAGHTVFVETSAGVGSGFSDVDYQQAGATVVATAAEVFAVAEMIVKVKEPQLAEIELLRRGQVVFSFFHFAASRQLTENCLGRGIVAIAYETVEDKAGHLPLLTPMSEIAGKMAVQQGAKYLEKPAGGRGVLLGGVPGVTPAHVVILGAGVVGTQAARVAAGMGANVVLMDINLDRLRHLDEVLPANVTTLFSDPHSVADQLPRADLVIGAVLVTGASAPRLVSREQLKLLQSGCVLVDVAIDQGGCIETSRPTTHASPTFIIDGIVHYCVGNIPGAVPRTSTFALSNATLPFVLKIANRGWATVAAEDPGFARGINMVEGRLTHSSVARTFGLSVSSI